MRKSGIGLISLLLLLLSAVFPAMAQETALLRVGHFAPDAPAVDIYIGGGLAVEDLTFTEVTGLIELPAGDYEIVVSPVGTSIEDAVIGPLTVTAQADQRTTIAAYGSLARGTLAATVFTEEQLELDDSTAVITLLHTIEGEGGIDLFSRNILFMESVRFPDERRDGAFTREIPAGRYNFDVAVDIDRDTVIREANGVELEGGNYYLLAASGPQSPQGELLVITDEGRTVEDDESSGTSATDPASAVGEGTALVRVAHFSPDTPPVDVYVDGEALITDLVFGAVTGLLELDSGEYEIAVAPAGTSVEDAAIGPLSLTFAADQRATVAAVGSLEDDTLTATVFTEEVVELDDRTAILTLLHTIEGEIPVDLYGSGIQLMRAVAFPGENNDGAFTREIPQGRYNFDLTLIDNADAVIREINAVEIEGGNYYLLVAAGSQSASGRLILVTDEGRTPEASAE